jgi:GT2 family glycosyltransferase
MSTIPVAAVVLIGEAEVELAPAAARAIGAQRGAAVEAVLVDATLAGHLVARAAQLRSEGWARVVRGSPASRGASLAAGLEASTAEVVLLWEPGAAYADTRAAQQLRALLVAPQALLCTCDVAWVREDDLRLRQLVDQSADVPPGGWHAGLALRRSQVGAIDRAAFAPAELALLAAARERGLVVHVPKVLASLPEHVARAHGRETELDARLLALARQAPLAEPLVTVLLATHDRCATLLDCLAGFARQLVRPGTLEIVVVDDASSDATSHVLPHVAPHCRLVHLRQDPGAGAAAARNLGLPHARGTYVLFVNDDTIPEPDLVAAHLAALKDLGPGAMVLGSFRPPAEILAHALDRVLDAGTLVFGYPSFDPGQELPGGHFYTCNASVELAAVRAASAFDASYSRCGAEDTDLGLRLVAAGQRLFYRPECRAAHRHSLSFDDFRRRQRTYGAAHVKLYREHPELVRGQTWSLQTTQDLAATAGRAAPVVPIVERAARHLGEVDLSAIEALGDDGRAIAKAVTDLLDQAVRRLHNVYWGEGLLAGFEAAGLDGFPALLAAADADARNIEVHSHA